MGPVAVATNGAPARFIELLESELGDSCLVSKWSLQALRLHVESLGHKPDSRLREAIRSVDRSIQIFHYHACEARDALKGIIKDGEPPTEEHIMLGFGAGEQQEQYRLGKLASEAHLIACLHSARSMYDIFSHIVNGLLLAQPLAVESCDIYKVRDQLPAGPLRTSLDNLLSSDWFRYIQGFINTSKHRRLVKHDLHVSFVDNVAGIQVSDFEYKGKLFPKYWATEVLGGAYEVKNKIVDCGRELNAACGIAP